MLILYLGMDVGDTRPLIVDQPDENLDNESIYALLTTYFKSAKKRRQIILITHNPNLVVNGASFPYKHWESSLEIRVLTDADRKLRCVRRRF